MTVEEVQSKANDKDLIMLCILNNKIHHSEGYKNMSVNGIANLFSKYFPFMTANKIQRFVNKYWAKIEAAKSNKSKSHDNSTKSNNSPESVIDLAHVTGNESNQTSKYDYSYSIHVNNHFLIQNITTVLL